MSILHLDIIYQGLVVPVIKGYFYQTHFRHPNSLTVGTSSQYISIPGDETFILVSSWITFLSLFNATGSVLCLGQYFHRLISIEETRPNTQSCLLGVLHSQLLPSIICNLWIWGFNVYELCHEKTDLKGGHGTQVVPNQQV